MQPKSKRIYKTAQITKLKQTNNLFQEMGSNQKPVHTKYLHWLSLHFVHRQEMLAIFVDIPL